MWVCMSHGFNVSGVVQGHGYLCPGRQNEAGDSPGCWLEGRGSPTTMLSWWMGRQGMDLGCVEGWSSRSAQMQEVWDPGSRPAHHPTGRLDFGMLGWGTHALPDTGTVDWLYKEAFVGGKVNEGECCEEVLLRDFHRQGNCTCSKLRDWDKAVWREEGGILCVRPIHQPTWQTWAELAWVTANYHSLLNTKAKAVILPGRTKPQYLQMRLEQGMGNIRLGHDTNLYMRKSGPGGVCGE